MGYWPRPSGGFEGPRERAEVSEDWLGGVQGARSSRGFLRRPGSAVRVAAPVLILALVLVGTIQIEVASSGHAPSTTVVRTPGSVPSDPDSSSAGSRSGLILDPGPGSPPSTSSTGCPTASTTGSPCSAPMVPTISPLATQYTGWGNMTPYLTVSPPARTGAAMAYDANASDQYLVMFGGEGASGALGDTWTYSHGVWTNVTPIPINSTNSPPARFGSSMAYDASDGYVLLFGGATGPYTGSTSPMLNDTWAFEHGSWTELCGACGPGPRVDASVTALGSTGGVDLFGGLGISGGAFSSLGDMWSFSGGAWTQLAPAASPSPRFDAGLSLDPTSNELVLFGGCARTQPTSLPSCASVLNDTWGYSAGSWSLLPAGSSSTPPGRWSMGFENGPAADGPLLFGGQSSAGLLADTWEEKSGSWTDYSSIVLESPSPRSSFAFAWDNSSADQYIVLFGGTNGTLLNETWVYPSPFNPLRVTAPAANRTALDAGDQLTMNVTVVGGAGKNNITWFGLPSGCYSTNSTKLACRPGTPTGVSTTYSISVRVRDKLHSIVWSAATTVTVNPIPTVAISGSPTNVGQVPLMINLSATTLWGTPPFAFAWVLGDGSNATGQNVNHTYSKVGRYLVTVWANDSVGQSIDAHYAVQVVGPFSAALAIQPASPFGPGTSLTLEAIVTGGEGPYSYAWSGLPSSCASQDAQTISCTVTQSGTYAVTVTVSDFFGTHSVAYLNFTVTTPWYDSVDLWVGVAGAIVVVAVVWAALRRRRKPAAVGAGPVPTSVGAAPPSTP
jgi:PKD domain